MRAATALVALFAAVVPLSAFTADDAGALVARIRASGAMMDDLRELCDRVGGRPTGSAAGRRAEEWAARKLRAAGVDSVHFESYRVPASWISRAASANCTAPAEFRLRIAAAPMTAGTPKGGAVEGALVDFGDGTTPDKVPPAKGKIAFVRTPLMKGFDDLFLDYMRIPQLIEGARRSGVAAMLIESSQARSLLYRHPMSLDGSVVPLPVAVVARDDAERLARLMEQGEVRVSLRLDNEIGPSFEARNVVGEIRGTDAAGELVLFGAHLDSWDLGTGALDNGVNSATVIDVARNIQALGVRPRRTMRFILFTGEELGMLGSRAYAEAHRDEMPRVALMLTADIGSGRTTGFFLNGREELRPVVETALAPLLPVAQQHNLADAIDGTDNFDFLLWGVPNLVANQEAAPYLPDYHAESDTFDKVDAAAAKENEAVDAAVLWSFANAESRLRQQSRAEVDELLVQRQLVDPMKAFAQWEEWASGRRGLPKAAATSPSR